MTEAVFVPPPPLNCPRCPRRMEYVDSSAYGTYLYRCADHAEWELGRGGLYRPPGREGAAGYWSGNHGQPPVRPGRALR